MKEAVGYGANGNNHMYGQGGSDVGWQNTAFKARLLSLDDLADKEAKRGRPIPHDDLLDKYKIADRVKGIGLDTKEHEGKILKIVKDENGNGAKVFIHCDKMNKEVEVLPSSLIRLDSEDRPTRVEKDISPNTNQYHGQNMGSTDTVEAEDLTGLKHLVLFENFKY